MAYQQGGRSNPDINIDCLTHLHQTSLVASSPGHSNIATTTQTIVIPILLEIRDKLILAGEQKQLCVAKLLLEKVRRCLCVLCQLETSK